MSSSSSTRAWVRLLVPAEQLGHRGDVGADGLVGEQPDLLDDVADPAAQLDRVDVGDVLAVELDPPRRRLDQPVDHLQRRRLAAPGRPDERDELAARHVEVELLDRDGAAGVGLADALQPDHQVFASVHGVTLAALDSTNSCYSLYVNHWFCLSSAIRFCRLELTVAYCCSEFQQFVWSGMRWLLAGIDGVREHAASNGRGNRAARVSQHAEINWEGQIWTGVLERIRESVESTRGLSSCRCESGMIHGIGRERWSTGYSRRERSCQYELPPPSSSSSRRRDAQPKLRGRQE